MADSNPKKDATKAHEPPKPVHIGGETLVDRLLPHIKKIIIGTVVLAVILAGVFGYRAYKRSKQTDDTVRLDKVLAVAQRPVVDKAMAADIKIPVFNDQKERAQAVLAELKKSTSANITAALRGGAHLDAGEYDQAIEEFKKGLEAKELDGVLAREGLGLALEAKATAEKADAAKREGLYKEALDAYGKMQPEETGPRRAYALYHTGRIQLKLGKVTEAKASFEAAKKLGGESSEVAQLVERRLANLGAS